MTTGVPVSMVVSVNDVDIDIPAGGTVKHKRERYMMDSRFSWSKVGKSNLKFFSAIR